MAKKHKFIGNKAFWYYEGGASTEFNTIVQHLVDTTPEFKAHAKSEAPKFCKVAQQIVAYEQKSVAYTQTSMHRKFGISKRAFAQAKMIARAKIVSAVACRENDIATKEDKFERNAYKYFETQFDGSPKHVVSKLRKRLIDIEQELERIVDPITGKPKPSSVFMYGAKIYYDQHKYADHAQWKREYILARSPQFGAMGSRTDLGGNGMYPIRFLKTEMKEITSRKQTVRTQVYWFELRHKGKRAGKFHLTADEGIPLRDILAINNAPQKFKDLTDPKRPKGMITTGRIPIQVMFNRHGNNWNIHISYRYIRQPKPKQFAGTVGIDRNNGHLEACQTIVNGTLQLRHYRKLDYERLMQENAAVRNQAIYQWCREIVKWAKDDNCIVVLEDLDFEGIKACEDHPLCPTLHRMGYKKVEAKIEREAFIHGVEVRYVNAANTSLLGNLIATLYPELGRDTAAGAVIGLRGTKEGNTVLAELCRRFLLQKKVVIRINCKGKCGQHIRVVNSSLGQTHTGSGNTATEVGTLTDNQIQKYVGGLISGISKSLSRQWRSKGKARKGKRTHVMCRVHADGSTKVKVFENNSLQTDDPAMLVRASMERAAEAQCTRRQGDATITCRDRRPAQNYKSSNFKQQCSTLLTLW